MTTELLLSWGLTWMDGNTTTPILRIPKAGTKFRWVHHARRSGDTQVGKMVGVLGVPERGQLHCPGRLGGHMWAKCLRRRNCLGLYIGGGRGKWTT